MPVRVRELRFGKPKVWKTNSVVGSYPRPLFVANFDEGGLGSVRGVEITTIPRSELPAYLAKKPEELPPVTAINYGYGGSRKIGTGSTVAWSAMTIQAFITDINSMLPPDGKCPFSTVVLDSLTNMNDAVIGMIGQLNGDLMKDARKWAGLAGAKNKEILTALCGLDCQNVVVIAHEMTQENETTGVVQTLPAVTGGFRESIGAFFSQFFYAATEMQGNGQVKGVIYTTPRGLVKAIGQRFSDTLPAVCGPRYEDIYGGKP